MLVRGWAIWRAGDRTIIEAVREAAGENFALAHYALVEMRHVLLQLDLDEWEKHPARLRAEVRSLFKRAIARITPHRGGWHVPPPRTPPRRTG